MEELYDLGQRSPESTDINLWIFPHLKEFLTIDLRWDTPTATVLNTADVFSEAFFTQIERDFGQMLREIADYPFAHLLDLPLRVEELVRETGMQSILERLGRRGKGDEYPTVAVFIVSGAALTMDAQQIDSAFRSILGDGADPALVLECSKLLERLIAEEHKVVKRIGRQELREALEEQSPNFFTLWERRN